MAPRFGSRIGSLLQGGSATELHGIWLELWWMGSEPLSKVRCPICSRLFLGDRLADHLVQDHIESVPELLASWQESIDARRAAEGTFPCTGCKRVFGTEAELTRHWYGRHGRSVSGQPDEPCGELSPELSARLAQFAARSRSRSAPSESPAASEASQSEAFGSGSATWNSGTHKIRTGGGPDRGYSYVENKRMAKRARLLSEASARAPSPTEPYRGSPVRPPIKPTDGREVFLANTSGELLKIILLSSTGVRTLANKLPGQRASGNS